jgi:hypothetical protein
MADIIQFPGSTVPPEDDKDDKDEEDVDTTPSFVFHDADGNVIELGEDRTKAIGALLSGMDFVFVGVLPVDGGADFVIAMEGEKSIQDAYEHLPGAIAHIMDQRGW